MYSTDPQVQSSLNQNNQTRKSFIDNKPMIQGLVRSVLKVEKNGQAHLINTGLTDNQGAKQIAQNLFSFYDREKTGSINIVNTMPILANAYRVFNSDFKPQNQDVNSFFQTLDVDRNNKISQEDLEALCIKYLTGSAPSVGYRFQDSRNRPF